MSADFTAQLQAILTEYETHSIEEIRSIVNEVSAEAVSELQTAWRGGGTGAYNAGWTSKPESRGNNYKRTIFGRSPTYRLAHLLENGHAKRNGGRVGGTVHIAPISQAATEKLIERLKGAFKG